MNESVIEDEIEFGTTAMGPSDEEELKTGGLGDHLNDMDQNKLKQSQLNIHATPFSMNIRKIYQNHRYDNEGFFEDLYGLFREINKLSVPIKYEKNQFSGTKPPDLWRDGQRKEHHRECCHLGTLQIRKQEIPTRTVFQSQQEC